MPEEEPVEPNTEGETHEVRTGDGEVVRRWGTGERPAVWPGREFDVRPDPGGVHQAEDTQLLRMPPDVGTSPVSPAPRQSLWPDANTTGAFVSRAASTRHEVTPRRWYDVAWWMILLWAIVVGVPAAGAVWAVWTIWGEVNGR